MRPVFRFIYRLLIALIAVLLGAFAIVDGLSNVSMRDIVLATIGAAVIGIAYRFGKRFVPDSAPPAWALLVLVLLFGAGYSLVENTSVAFVLFGATMICGGVAYFIVGFAPQLLGIDPKTYEYGSNMFFDAILLPNNNARSTNHGNRESK